MESEVAEIKPTNPPAVPVQALSIFSDSAAFRQAAEMATFLAKSTLVPKDYQNNASNTMIAIDIANRIGASPLMVMQNLYIVHGKPSWSSSFVISVINACGRFSHLRFEFDGEGDDRRCWATTRTREGEQLEGPEVSIKMARAEGWYTRSGSKWPTMSELMLRYRAAAFFGRLYCPDILNGMYTADEVDDFVPPEPRAPQRDAANTNSGQVPPRDRAPRNPAKSRPEPISDELVKAIEAGFAVLGRDWREEGYLNAIRATLKRHLDPQAGLESLTAEEGALVKKQVEFWIQKRAERNAKQPETTSA